MRMMKSLRFQHLARLCRYGDTEAMLLLARWFRAHFNRELEDLVSRYEENPGQPEKRALSAYVEGHPDEGALAGHYMLWVMRSAMYGNPEGERLLARCKYYEDGAYVPKALFYGKRLVFKYYIFSDLLYKAGITDIPKGQMGAALSSFCTDKGYFVFSYESSYIPPDKDGFGREETNECLYYDEFFNRVPIEYGAPPDKVRAALAKLEKNRERYWDSQGEGAKGRKYEKRLYIPL